VTSKLTTSLALLAFSALTSACASSTATPATPAATTAAPAPPATATPPATAPVTPSAPVPQTTTAAAAEQELPDGKGKQILTAACTGCHDLREVTKFRGFYTRAQWRDIVVTMVEYGAPVVKTDVEVLADYLEQHLGKK
jgi:glucose/arabinose dehydrogenase